MKQHLQNPEGAGRNILSVLCCNYYFIKIIAEPFLNTSRGVQDMVENTAECVQMTRNRMSCTDFLSSAALNNMSDTDVESGLMVLGPDGKMKYLHSEEDKEKKFLRRSNGTWVSWLSTICTPAACMTSARIFHWLTVLFSVGIVLLFIYASFTI